MKALKVSPYQSKEEVIIYTTDIYKYEDIDDGKCKIYCNTPEGIETYELPISANDLVVRIHDINPDDFEIITIEPPESGGLTVVDITNTVV